MTSIGSNLRAQPKSFCQFKFADRKQLYDVPHNGLKPILKEQFDIKNHRTFVHYVFITEHFSYQNFCEIQICNYSCAWPFLVLENLKVGICDWI